MISARWLPHILSNDQIRVRVQTAKQFFKMFPNFSQRQIANIAIGFTISNQSEKNETNRANQTWYLSAVGLLLYILHLWSYIAVQILVSKDKVLQYRITEM
jgi:hypothetical protein